MQTEKNLLPKLDFNKKLDDFLENEKKETMGGATEILSIGFVIVSAIVATSVQYKDGEHRTR